MRLLAALVLAGGVVVAAAAPHPTTTSSVATSTSTLEHPQHEERHGGGVEKNADPDNRGAAAVLVDEHSTTSTVHPHGTTTTTQQRKEACYEAITAWSTLALAIVTATLVVVGYWVGANQIALMEEQSALQKGALEATKTAAEAATVDAKNTSAALEHTKRAERAWIAFEITDIPVGRNELLGFWQDQERIPMEQPQMLAMGMRGVFRNGGRTPARVTSGVLNFGCVVRETLPPEPKYGVDPNRRVPEALLLPGAATTSEVPLILTQDDLKGLVSSERVLIVYGFIAYKDVWDGTHETRFCFTCRLPRARPARGMPGPSIAFELDGPEAYNRLT